MTGQQDLAAQRLIKRGDLVACSLAFVDCKLPGSTLKENYSIIGAGVTQSADQVVNLDEPHGFAVGGAAMPHGVTNNLHMHYTAEVFIIASGEWRFRWGPNGDDGELTGRAGDVVSIPTWIFRGFTNIGPDDGFIYTALGRDESGGVIWHPSILESAAGHGIYLTRDNMLVDTASGAAKPAADALMQPLTPAFIATLRHYSVDDLRARTTAADERAWSRSALLDSVLPGHASEIAPVIGHGMSQDRLAAPKVVDPHGFSVEWLRIAPGEAAGAFRVAPKQVLILFAGALEIELDDTATGGSRSTARVEPRDVFAVPGGIWRTLRSVGDETAVMSVTTAGDARALVEWPAETVERAFAAGVGVDPNFYLAPAELLPFDMQPARRAA